VSPAAPYVPAAQLESQAEAPAPEKVPAAQGWQTLLVLGFANFPATQSSHSSAPSPLTFPGAQSEQELAIAPE